VQALFDDLNGPRPGEFLPSSDVDSCVLRFSVNSRLTGRAVLVPGYHLRLGEVGLPEDMAWTFYAPLIANKASESEIAARRPKARRALESVMRESVVVINRAPTWDPTSITAFAPVITPGLSIRLHPLCCRMFNADFDGDQAAVWLPISRPAQEEAKEKLTIAGHLKRDPSVLVYHLTPSNSAMVGLAYAAECDQGRAELASIWPGDCPQPDLPLTRAGLSARLMEVFERGGPEVLLPLLQELYTLGVRWATQSGSSLSPFVGSGLRLPTPPTSSFAASWCAHATMVDTEIAAQADSDPTVRPVMRRIRCGARGSIAQLRALVGPWGTTDPYDRGIPIKHGFRDGLTTDELWQWTTRARARLQEVASAVDAPRAEPAVSAGDTFLRRAMSSRNPGPIFAEAAGRSESDPLTDLDVRLWIGLLPS
jgi:hypothetical protein